MELLELIRQAIESGASDEELQVLIAQNIQDFEGLDNDALVAFKNELTDDQQRTFENASIGALAFGEERDTDLFASLFGDPESRLVQGVGPIPGGGTITNVATGAVKNIPNTLLNRIGSQVLKAVVPKSFKGFLGRAVAGYGAFGLATGGFGGDGGGEEGPPPTVRTGPEQALIDQRRGLGVGRTAVGGVPAGAEQMPPGLNRPGAVKDGFNVLIIDHDGSLTGTPGSLAVMTPRDLGLTQGITPGQQVNISSQSVLSPELAAFQGQLGLSDATVMAGGVGMRPDIAQVLFPETLGDIRVTTPTQVGKSGADIVAETEPASRAEAARATQDRRPVGIPSGAELTPRVFQQYQGRTLLEWASAAAQKHGVPLNILYGIVAHESGWNPNAVGDNGQSHGLAQIYQPTWGGQVSVAQSKNPIFALNWTARMLRERFNSYGRWDAAVAAHNSPVAANFLVSTGKFKDKKSQNYVLDVLTRSNNSGLADYIASADDTATEIADGAGSGPKIAPFQEPDPAASRQYIKETYQDKLGRQPTEEELRTETKRIRQLALGQYKSEVRRTRGQSSTAVDPAAQFEEGIEEMGEFEFHEDVKETQSFTDYAAQIARMMQVGL